MKRLSRKHILWIVGGVILVGFIVYGFLPDPVSVQTAHVERGPLRVLIEEEGETRVVSDFTVTAPVTAYMRRIELEAGDPVQAGQPLVALEPPRTPDEDPRTRRQMATRVEAARAAVAQAIEQARAAEAAAQQAVEERNRLARLEEAGAATRQALERADAEARQASAALEGASATVAAARAELAATEAALQPAPTEGPVQQVIRAPASGRVLAVHRRSAGPVTPGEPLLEVGDTGRLEVRVDVLSQDAVRIPHGGRVLFDQWGGNAVLQGTVERIEPQAFTRVSALGVEEQRVMVIASLPMLTEAAPLGSGYRVLAQFVVWEGDNVLQVPSGALFRVDDGWGVFVIEGGRAVRREVSIGQRSGLTVQILDGLTENDLVIVHPDDRISEGVRVRPRER